MAERLNIPRAAAQGLILCAVACGLLPLVWLLLRQNASGAVFDGAIVSVTLFTLKQALLSTLLSVVPGLLVARALARQDFHGRQLLLVLFALPMAVPAIVAVLGLTAIFGQSGLFPHLMSPYGLAGILLAHVFFNLPMAARLFYQALQATPAEGYKLAAQLGLGPVSTFRHVEWPALKSVLPQTAALVFLLCAASFVIVLTLGGASSTTLEVAIYQALRMDFDPPRALALCLIQIVLCVSLIGFAQAALRNDAPLASLRHGHGAVLPLSTIEKIINAALVLAAALLVLPPLAIIIVRGLPYLHFTAPTFLALATSLGLGLSSGLVTLLLAWPLAKSGDRISQLLSLAGLILPPAVLATGWFLLLFRTGEGLALTLFVIMALNVLMALPFSVAALRAGFARIAPPLRRLQSQLGVSGYTGFRIIDWPLMRRQAAQAFLLAMVLSLGDLTAVTLLGNNGILTLPTLLHAEMGHYRGDDAAGTALVLLALCAALTILAQRAGGSAAET